MTDGGTHMSRANAADEAAPEFFDEQEPNEPPFTEDSVDEQEPNEVPVVAAPVCLTYVGRGAYIAGVPTTDLCKVPANEADRLVASGLYERADCADGAGAQPGD